MEPAPLEPGAGQLLVQLEQAGALTSTGLTLTDPNMPRGQAEAIGSLLGYMHKEVIFAIGDWLIFIEQVYPQEWSQMSELLGLSEDRRIEYRRVSAQVPKSVRRPNVDWSHHRAVASLKVLDSETGRMVTDHKAQQQWLQRVEDERLSHHALRDALRNGKPAVGSTSCRCCGRPYDAA